MATLAKVYDGTLELLGILGLGQTISADDSARMVRSYTQVYADLKTEGLASWASTANVPDEIVPHMEALMAINAVDTYYVSDARYKRIMNKVSIAKREIRRLTIPDHESLEDPVDY